jgi:hypothetical protein
VTDEHLQELVADALEAQEREYESDFEIVNGPLTELLATVHADEVLHVGEALVTSTGARCRVLGARVLRENWDRRDDALAAILDALSRENDLEVTGWLLSAVGFIGDESSLEAVLPFGSSDDAFVREQAGNAIAESAIHSGDARAARTLIDMAADADWSVRFSAVFELGRWWEEGVCPDDVHAALKAALEDSDERIRMAATDSLGA